ncbi:hypothetical protein C2G38_2190249 [Gigaspora rosea]|uniref:Uncharacterized protein n=1 Tax=Gigaspora rosea TaxID=44941 RepID=A0A397V2V7_9GLOM|nr:hypothetical protein C2G38_2190249 [Gigaspora rosea]
MSRSSIQSKPIYKGQYSEDIVIYRFLVIILIINIFLTIIFEVVEFLRSERETVALAVVIAESPYIRGLKFEVDIVEALRSISAKVIHKGKKLKAHRGHRFSGERSFFLVSGRPVIDELLGVLTRTKQPKETIGIVLGLAMGNFIPGAINAALEITEPPEPSELLEPLEQLPIYPIIVTDKARLHKYLINAVLDRVT